MSICFRTLSCKLTSFVGQRHSIVQLDRRLTKLISTSVSLQEDCNSSLKQIINDEVSLISPTCKTFGLKNIGHRLYSTAPKLSKKPIETSVDDKYSETTTSEDSNRNDGPSKEQLEHIFNTLQHDLPKFFCTSIDYRIYDYKLEFINNYKGVRTNGIHDYIKQVLYLRVTSHLMYAYVKFDILKITLHPENNTVKVRWRIRGLSSLKVFSQFWKLKLSNFTESLQRLETWHDGFSTYYVNSSGLVYKHVVDKMMPDDGTIPAKDKPNIAAKLAA